MQDYFIKKRVRAENISEALKKEKTAPVIDIWSSAEPQIGYQTKN